MTRLDFLRLRTIVSGILLHILHIYYRKKPKSITKTLPKTTTSLKKCDHFEKYPLKVQNSFAKFYKKKKKEIVSNQCDLIGLLNKLSQKGLFCNLFKDAE